MKDINITGEKSPEEADTHGKVDQLLGGLLSKEAAPEDFVKLEIIPGRIMKSNEDYPGQPAGYFVRPKGTEDTLEYGEFENMMTELFGFEVLDFIAASNSPQSMKKAAEELKEKLENPEVQKRIRKLYAEQQKLKKIIYE